MKRRSEKEEVNKEVVDYKKIWNTVIEIWEEDSTIKDFKKDYSDKIEKKEASRNYKGENVLHFLKIEFPVNNWKYLTKKISYPYEYFKCLDDYKKQVKNSKKNKIFSLIWKTNLLVMKKLERTRGVIKQINIRNGEELTDSILLFGEEDSI